MRTPEQSSRPAPPARLALGGRRPMGDLRTPTLLALLAAAFPASALETVLLPGSGYAVQFPSTPDCTSTTLGAPGASIPKTTCSAFDQATGHGFTAEYMVMPEPSGKATPEELLMGAASGSAAYSDSRITSHQHLDAGGHPALEATLEPNGEGYVAFVRYVLAGNVLIMVTADGFRSADPSPDATLFLQSLKFQGAAPGNSSTPTPSARLDPRR